MPHRYYDVVIGGGGPAGSAAAAVLCQAGLRVALVDDVDDRELKIGESLPGAAIRLLQKLGIASLDQLLPETAHHKCVANVSAWGSDDWSRQDAILNPEGGGWHLVRHQFDAALRRHAESLGVEWLRCKIGGSSSNQNSVDEESAAPGYRVLLKGQAIATAADLHASWVVDATGRRGAVARRFNANRQRIDQQMAVIARVRCPVSDVDLTTRVKSVADGWWYTARLPDSSRVVVFHGLAARIAELVKTPALFLEALNATDLLPYQPGDHDLTTGLTATQAGISRLEPAFGRNWLAAGDAALAQDPLSSQGILFALYSGVKAGESIAAAIRSPQQAAHACRNYQTLIDRVFAASQQARRHYYASELRFPDEPFWQERWKSVEQNAAAPLVADG